MKYSCLKNVLSSPEKHETTNFCFKGAKEVKRWKKKQFGALLQTEDSSLIHMLTPHKQIL